MFRVGGEEHRKCILKKHNSSAKYNQSLLKTLQPSALHQLFDKLKKKQFISGIKVVVFLVNLFPASILFGLQTFKTNQLIQEMKISQDRQPILQHWTKNYVF